MPAPQFKFLARSTPRRCSGRLNPIRLNSPIFLSVFFVLWAAALWLIPDTLSVMGDYIAFSLLGITGAIFANATGAGGGVVFIPMFNQLGFTEVQAIATSFGIQCFGMTAGAFTWIHHYRHDKIELHLWHSFVPIIALTGAFAVLGVWLVYGLNLPSPASLHESFSIFSIVLGLAILVSVFFLRPGREHSNLEWYDCAALGLIGIFGGIITAWLSVGVGELLAIYLILRRFDVTMAVASAVVVSALVVWSAALEHFWLNPKAYWQVLLFAGPGAVIGGIFAKTLVSWLSARKLKIFFATWVLVVGVVTSPLASLV
tara:strand:+ start:1135 stop:2079 length:945 start_codon:yes stop_codon:yes gene_type:complete